MEYPIPTTIMSYYNSNTLYHETFNEAYISMLGLLLGKGSLVHPRPGSSLGATKEILNASFTIPSTMPLLTIAERGLCYPFAMLEPFYLFTNQAETDIVGALSTYAPNLVNLAFNEKYGEFDGNYGDRIELRNPKASEDTASIMREDGQLWRCYNILKKDPSSRRAVLTIHNPVWDVVDGESKDIPCTLNLQFIIRDKQLHCFCQMRSNDIWYGTPHNVMMFTFLQRAMAGWLGVKPGEYIHRANSLHIYEKHWEKAAMLVDNVGKPGFLRSDISPRIIYPTHASPAVTYRKAKEMIQKEAALRSFHAQVWIKEDVDLEDTYEQHVADTVDNFLLLKKEREKLSPEPK